MAGDKVKAEFEIQSDAEAFLSSVVEKYDLPDRDKAIRILLDYAMNEGDRDAIFGEVRCLRCED
jgi:hypothetical protein